MMRSALPVLLSGLCAAFTLTAAPARADPVADAKDLFARGRDLRNQGDCSNAVGLFRKAYELYPQGLGSLRNLAECDEQLDHFASSRREWLDLKRALLGNGDHKYDGWTQDADQAAARLAPKLATLTLDVNVVDRGGGAAGAASKKGVDVTLDGEILPPALVGTPLERDPGRHVVRVAGDAVQEPAQKTVDLVAGDVKRVALRVVVKADHVDPDDAVPPPAPRPPPPDDEHARALAAKRTWAWIAIGVGGASLVGAGVSLGVRQSALDSLNRTCPTHQGCPQSVQSDASTGGTASTLVTVFGAIGIVGLVGGIVLLATSMGPPQQASSLVVAPAFAPGYGGAAARWTF
jgi:hypothetical protein